jgi:hypothetical protein
MSDESRHEEKMQRLAQSYREGPGHILDAYIYATQYMYRQKPKPRKRWGVLFRKGSLWVGAHWSPKNRRWCINLIPFVTFWFILDGGITPQESNHV